MASHLVSTATTISMGDPLSDLELLWCLPEEFVVALVPFQAVYLLLDHITIWTNHVSSVPSVAAVEISRGPKDEWIWNLGVHLKLASVY